MKTKYIIKGLVENELVYFVGIKNETLWNIEDFEVRTCSATINGATQYDSYEDAIDVIREYQLLKFEPFPVCPRCKKDYMEKPSISRDDNITEICPDCGIQEALITFMRNTKKRREN